MVGSILALSFAVIGIASATPIFFALTSEYLSAGAVAGGLALVSSLGNLGPALSPSINGFILRSTGDNIYSMYFVMALYLLSRNASAADDTAGSGRRWCAGGGARALTGAGCMKQRRRSRVIQGYRWA